MTTAIFFDLDGTLITYERSFVAIFETACERVGIEYDPAVYEYYTERFFAHFEDFRPNPFVTAAREAVQKFDLNADGKDLGEARIDAEIEATRVPEGVRVALADLRERHALGVLTNGVESVQRRKLVAHDLDRFETVVVSEAVGAMKPDPAIFERAKDAIPAGEYVYVGDSVDHDLPAGKCGFRTVLVGIDDVDEADLTIPGHSELGRVEELVSGS
jgi:putative hydrolase of the HAD superfamily